MAEPANQPGLCKCGKTLVKHYVELGLCAKCYKTEFPPMCKCKALLKGRFIELNMCKVCEKVKKQEDEHQRRIQQKEAERQEKRNRFEGFERDPVKWQKDFDDRQAKYQKEFEQSSISNLHNFILQQPKQLEEFKQQQPKQLEEFKQQQPKQLEEFKLKQIKQLEEFKQQQPKQLEEFNQQQIKQLEEFNQQQIKQREQYLTIQLRDFEYQQKQREDAFKNEVYVFQNEIREKRKRVYLSTHYVERREASRMGAKWDAERKQWYAPNGEEWLVNKWAVNNDNVVLLTGEDRTFGGNELYIDLIPSSCWFTNVRSCVHPRDWDRLRRHVYERVNNKCECCNIDPGDESLEAHERWQYDEHTRTQKLVRLIALCNACHLATHLGFANAHGDLVKAGKQLNKLRNFTALDIERHYIESLEINKTRSAITWNLDLSLITDNGIALLTDIPDKDTRKEIAVSRLAILNNVEDVGLDLSNFSSSSDNESNIDLDDLIGSD